VKEIIMWQRPSNKYCNDSACVEVRCDGGACVEVGRGGAGVLLRATEAPETVVELTPEEFSAFLQAVKGGEYDSYVRVI
jgi:hypothetical protein